MLTNHGLLLLAEEIAASRAYARALGRCGALPAAEAQALDDGLGQVLERARKDPAYLDLDAEDIHSFVETRLGEIVGEVAGQGHLGRSRNEQAVTAQKTAELVMEHGFQRRGTQRVPFFEQRARVFLAYDDAPPWDEKRIPFQLAGRESH